MKRWDLYVNSKVKKLYLLRFWCRANRSYSHTPINPNFSGRFRVRMQYLGISHEMLRVDSLDKKNFCNETVQRATHRNGGQGTANRVPTVGTRLVLKVSRFRSPDWCDDELGSRRKATRLHAQSTSDTQAVRPIRQPISTSPFALQQKKIKSKKKNDLVIFRFIERYQALFRPFFFASNLCHQTLKLNIFHSNWTLYETVERQPLINRLIWKQPFSEIVSSSYDLRHRILESTWLDHFIDSSCFIAFQSDEIRFFCSNALRTSFDWLILFSTL